jgi:hypothetical protein
MSVDLFLSLPATAGFFSWRCNAPVDMKTLAGIKNPHMAGC